MQGQSRRAAVLRPRRALPDLPGSPPPCAAVPCLFAGCDEVYCSESCRQRHAAAHVMICASRRQAAASRCDALGTNYSPELRARLAACEIEDGGCWGGRAGAVHLAVGMVGSLVSALGREAYGGGLGERNDTMAQLLADLQGAGEGLGGTGGVDAEEDSGLHAIVGAAGEQSEHAELDMVGNVDARSLCDACIHLFTSASICLHA